MPDSHIGLTPSNWIAIAAIIVPTLIGFIAWMTNLAWTIGKVLQEIQGISTDVKALTESRDSLEKHLNKIDIRVTVLETALEHEGLK